MHFNLESSKNYADIGSRIDSRKVKRRRSGFSQTRTVVPSFSLTTISLLILTSLISLVYLNDEVTLAQQQHQKNTNGKVNARRFRVQPATSSAKFLVQQQNIEVPDQEDSSSLSSSSSLGQQQTKQTRTIKNLNQDHAKLSTPIIATTNAKQQQTSSIISVNEASRTNNIINNNNRSQRSQRSQRFSDSQQEASGKCALILQRTYVRKTVDSNDFYLNGNATLGNSADLDNNNLFQATDKKERICITYGHINTAIADAKRRRKFNAKTLTQMVTDDQINSIEPRVPVVAELGELNQEVTRLLANKFDLSHDEIQRGLPMIDMSRTDMWPLCPLMVRPVECDPTGRFRSFTGHCNNLRNPTWGAAQTPFTRFLDRADYPDGIQAERRSVYDDSPLPSPRLVTSVVHRDHDQPSGDLSLLIMVWGQIIDHDLALAAPPRDENGLDFNCCKRQHPNCKPIQIPENDFFYSKFGQRCMDFKRSLAGLRPNCALGPRVHINTITATLDSNTIYGSTKAIADALRTNLNGQLKVQDIFRDRKPLMTQQLDRPDLDCFERPNENTFCFFGGDERVNEQPTLTVLHTLYVRDHNRMAAKLASLNPHWDDDRIYHETRHIQAAIAQHIVINEYLPLLIGHEMMVLYNLTSSPPGTYWDGYDPEISPSITHAFSTAAFRQGHTFIQGKVHLFDSKTHRHMGFEHLRNLFKRPFHYYKPGRMDQIATGILNTPAQTYDPFITEEISGHLFQEPGEQFGMDLPAINLARGREQGTPGYNVFREWCGLPRAQSFDDLQPYMNNRTAFMYSKLYKHVDDIDLWSGGISERRMAGSQIGPTFACIIARQFSNIKRGDRFWYENSGFPSAFTLPQLREIKKATQARLFCQNLDNLQMIQRNALKMAHPVFNPRVSCSKIPDLNLNYWIEDPQNPGSFQQDSG